MASGSEHLWRVHSCFGPARLEGRAVQDFADAVNAQSGGGLRLEVKAFGSSGIADPDLLQAVSAGRIEAATLYSEYFARDAPELALCYVQGVLETPEQHWRAFPTVSAIYAETFARWGVQWIAALARPVYDACIFGPDPIAAIEDLRGRTVRVWSEHQVRAFAKLGIGASVVPQHAMVEAFRSGAIDAALYMAEAAATTRLAEVAPFFASLHPFSAIQNVLGAGAGAWEALAPELRDLLARTGAETERKTLEGGRDTAAAAAEMPGFTRLRAFPTADRARFRSASLQAWEDMAKAAGPRAEANRRRVLAALEG